MGTEYRLIDPKNNVYYELGKGPWGDLINGHGGRVIIDDASEGLYERIYKAIEYFDFSEGPSREVYAREITQAIESRMGPVLSLVADCDEDAYDIDGKNSGYVEVGSRYHK